MDEDEVGMECDEGDGGASSSSGRQAALEQGFDVDALEVRAANETSAKLAAQADEPARVRKPQRRAKGRKTHNQRDAERRQQQQGNDGRRPH